MSWEPGGAVGVLVPSSAVGEGHWGCAQPGEAQCRCAHPSYSAPGPSWKGTKLPRNSWGTLSTASLGSAE